jgi:UPF0148 protein
MTETRSPDRIMAEYLLKGGKMLAKTCPVCYSPLFEYKGETFCVVCRENEAESSPDIPDTNAIHSSPVTSEVRSTGELGDEFTTTLRSLLIQAREEKDGNRIVQLMTAVKTGAEAYKLLF